MGSCLMPHLDMWGEALKNEHPLLGIIVVIALLALLLQLPLKLLRMMTRTASAGTGSIFRVIGRIIRFIFRLPLMLFGSTEDPVAKFRRFHYNVPYETIRQEALPRSQRPRRPFDWSNIVVYLAGLVVFLLLLDGEYNNCAGLDDFMKSLF